MYEGHHIVDHCINTDYVDILPGTEHMYPQSIVSDQGGETA